MMTGQRRAVIFSCLMGKSTIIVRIQFLICLWQNFESAYAENQ